jgi:Asp-tRNA(Asn)/Glu-tRNA(Gln) amidotransferase A subunit family amidase
MTDDELCYMSATEALAHFQDRALSPVELLAAVIRRADAIATTVNPFADRYFEEATRRATVAADRYHRSGARPHRLEGLPLAVKDAADIQGRRTTNGSLINKDRVDAETDPAIERLLRAGALLFARTTCPEFCWLYTCHSRMWGVTRNPWRLGITPGGSSGGSAAALAAGAATIATGSDSTGSIRQPASQCAAVGYKPLYGRVPLPATASFDTYTQIGPMTRTVDDAALMANVMAGPHPLNHASLPKKRVLPLELPGIAGFRIAYSLDLGHYAVIDDVRRETLASLSALADAGAEITEVGLPGASEAIRLAHAAPEFLFAPAIREVAENHGHEVSAYVPELAATANAVTADDYRRSLSYAGEFRHNCLGPILKTHDAFICPAVSCPEVPAENWQQTEILIDGHRLTDTDTAMTALFNMFSRCPVLSVPSGMTDAGLPTGLQIVGCPYDDATPFRVARALERRRPWLDTPARRPTLAGMMGG